MCISRKAPRKASANPRHATLGRPVHHEAFDTSRFAKKCREINVTSAWVEPDRFTLPPDGGIRNTWKRKSWLTAFNLKCWTFKEHYAAAVRRADKYEDHDEAFKDLISY